MKATAIIAVAWFFCGWMAGRYFFPKPCSLPITFNGSKACRLTCPQDADVYTILSGSDAPGVFIPTSTKRDLPWPAYLIGAVGLAVVGNYIYQIFFAKRGPEPEEHDENDDKFGGWT